MRIASTILIICLITAPLSLARKKRIPATRWTAGAPGCEFQTGDDGRYRWRMTRDDLDMTLIVDSQVLAQSRHRFYRVFAAYMSVTYTGNQKLEFPADLRLEFVRHHNVIVPNMEAGTFAINLQNDIDTMVFDTERAIKKDPSKTQEKTARARQYQKEASELIDFVTTQSLQPATLTPGNPEVHGWAFFRTDKNKWIGSWNHHEDFVLRVLMKGKVWEFPFSLPPAEGELILRKREE